MGNIKQCTEEVTAITNLTEGKIDMDTYIELVMLYDAVMYLKRLARKSLLQQYPAGSYDCEGAFVDIPEATQATRTDWKAIATYLASRGKYSLSHLAHNYSRTTQTPATIKITYRI